MLSVKRGTNIFHHVFRCGNYWRVIPRGQNRRCGTSTKWTFWVGGRKSRKEREQKSCQHTSIFIFTHSLTHTHARTENFVEVLKSPQCTLFVCFLFPYYIISATTTVAGGGRGSISSITQSCRHSCCTGSRSLCGVTCMFLWLWTIIRVLRCPRGPAGPAHGVDLCEQTSTRLILCIVL